METEYLRKRLEGIANTSDHADRIETEYKSSPYSIIGGLDARLRIVGGDIAVLLEPNGLLSRIEANERAAERLQSILEALDIDLDEDALAALELIGKRTWSNGVGVYETSPYQDERRSISRAINKTIVLVQESEREREHDETTDALMVAGFVYQGDDDCFDRGNQRVTVTLTNGRECRYAWEFQDNTSGDQVMVDSGKSGEFSRLLELIAPVSREEVKTQ